MINKSAITERPALDLLEDALALLRHCPPSVLLLYYVGALPYVIGFLYFWAEMSRGAFAASHLEEDSLLVGLAFLWCKAWQALFSSHLLATARGRPVPRWTFRRLLATAWPQIILQPTGLFLLPLAGLMTIPAGYVTAFYQNVTALALDESGEPLAGSALRKEAMAQAGQWARQNHIGLAMILFFFLAVLLNIFIVLAAFPWLLKTLFGIESAYTLSVSSILNTTLVATSFGLTYLCVDPVIKAFYALRCFKGRALATGEDLRVEARSLASAATARGLAAALALLCLSLQSVAAAEPPAAPVPTAPAPAQVNQAIDRVLERPEFAWRLPRAEEQAEKKGWLEGFIDGVFRTLGKWIRQIFRWIGDFFDWLEKLFRGKPTAPIPHESSPAGGSLGLFAILKLLSWVLLAGAAVVLAVLGWSRWQRRARPLELSAVPRAIPHDLTSEDVSADQLPEDEWLRLAREMIERGELRLALRALYLAALASLGEQQIISIARHKSNYEYQRELRRRRPAQTDLQAVFAETVRTFERVWYGLHEVTREMVEISRADLLKLRQGPPTL